MRSTRWRPVGTAIGTRPPGRNRIRATPRCSPFCAGLGANVGWRTRPPRSRPSFVPPQLPAPALVGAAYGKSVASTVRILRNVNAELVSLETELAPSFEKHPDAEIYRSLP